jgi:hypothetical protein
MQVLSRFVNGQPTVGPMLRHVGGWAVVVMMVLSCLPCSAHAAPQGSAANPATQASASPDVAKKDGSDNKPHNTGIVVGIIFVSFYAWYRFQTPATNRSSTTIIRYYTAASIYTLWAIALYLALAWVPDVLDQAAVLGVDWVDRLAAFGLPYPLIVALTLTVLLPQMGPLASLDSRFRDHLEYMAAIPYEARRLCEQLMASDTPGGEVSFETSQGMRHRVRAVMLGDSFVEDDVAFDGGRHLSRLWTKVVTLKLHIDEWKANRRYSGFLDTYRERLVDVSEGFAELNPRVRRCLRFLEAHPAQESEVAGEYEMEMERQVRKLLRLCYECISAGVLQCEFRLEDRRQRLASMGFVFSKLLRTSPVLMFHRLACLFSGLSVLLLFNYTVSWWLRHDSTTYLEIFCRSVFVSLTYVMAVLWAVLPRENRWHVAQRTTEEVRPVLFYLVAGACAVVSNLVLSMGWSVFKYWMTWSGDLKGGFRTGAPWLVVGFCTAFMIAFQIDNPLHSTLRRFGRWSEGACQAIVNLGAAIVVVLLQQWSLLARIDVVITGCMVGFALGSCVPTWFRVAPRSRPASVLTREREEDPLERKTA